MQRTRWMTVIGVLALGAALVAAQQQQSTTQPARSRQSRRLVQPWNQIKDLNDDVKTRIIELHRKSTEEIAAIRTKERQDIMALLTDDQKKQVNDFEAQSAQRSRARRTTTRPAGQ